MFNSLNKWPKYSTMVKVPTIFPFSSRHSSLNYQLKVVVMPSRLNKCWTTPPLLAMPWSNRTLSPPLKTTKKPRQLSEELVKTIATTILPWLLTSWAVILMKKLKKKSPPLAVEKKKLSMISCEWVSALVRSSYFRMVFCIQLEVLLLHEVTLKLKHLPCLFGVHCSLT